jgi:hypothetical protein
MERTKNKNYISSIIFPNPFAFWDCHKNSKWCLKYRMYSLTIQKAGILKSKSHQHWSLWSLKERICSMLSPNFWCFQLSLASFAGSYLSGLCLHPHIAFFSLFLIISFPVIKILVRYGIKIYSNSVCMPCS